MKLTYDDLQKMQHLQIDESVYVFDDSTRHLTHISLRKNERLKEIRFDTPQPNLVYLDASRCALEKVIFSQECDNLQAVYLHHNALVAMEIGVELPALALLDVSFNESLQSLEFKGFLRKLKYFYAHKCNLQNLESMANFFLRPGFDFNIAKNKNLVNPPTAIVSQGKDAVIRHFRKIREEGQDYLYEAKLLILGDPRAGKTTLARKILDTSADLPTEDETTRGIDLTPWNFNYPFTEKGEQNILVNIWDFGGQTIYKQTHRFFLTQRSLYVVLSDGGSSEKTDFSYWLHQTKTFGKGSPVVVFINEKEDRSFDVPMDALRKINPDLKDELAVNLEKVAGRDAPRFGQIMDKIKMEMASLKHLGEPVPKGWKRIRQHFLEMERAREKMVSWSYFKGVCEENEEKDPKGQESIAQYFHDIGIFLHFHDDDILRKQVFINKQWILNGAYKVVDSKAVEEKAGKLTKDEFNSLFSGEYDDYRAEIKALLKRFYLIYERDGYYVVPQHLPQGAPKYKWKSQENVRFNFAYKEYMPAGILWQFMVEKYRSIKDDLVWRRGVVLEFEGTVAEVIEEYGKDLIRIRVSGRQKEDVRAWVIRELQRINENFDDLSVLWQVPCVCEVCANDDDPSIFNYKRLVKMQEKGRRNEWCEKLENEVSIAKLLKGVEQSAVSERAGNTIVIVGDGNNVGQAMEHSKFQSTQGLSDMSSLVTKKDLGKLATHKDISTLHVRQDAVEDRLRDILALSLKHRDLLSENNRLVSDQASTLMEKLDKSVQKEVLAEIKTFMEGIIDDQAKAQAKQILDDDRIDMTAKLKFVTPLYIRELFGVNAELEFSKKEKLPRSWSEFKALFVKK